MSNYWQDRLIEEEDRIYKSNTKAILKELSNIYLETQRDVLKELLALRAINRASNNTAISREILLEDTLNRITRSIAILADNYNNLLTTNLTNTYTQTYVTVSDSLREVGALTTDIIPANVEDIIKANWSGTSFSNRIWYNRDTLIHKAKDTLSKGLIRGESYHNMASEITKTMGSSYSAARRLVETEVQVAQIKANVDNYKNNGIEKVEISAVLDKKVCNDCKEYDGKIVVVEKGIIGKDLPPFHPSCRCTTLPVIDIPD